MVVGWGGVGCIIACAAWGSAAGVRTSESDWAGLTHPVMDSEVKLSCLGEHVCVCTVVQV